MAGKYKRFEAETDDELIYRVCQDKAIIGSWQDVADILNELTGNSWTESTYRKRAQIFDKMFAANKSKFVDSEEQLADISERIRVLEKERRKLQTAKLEYSRWLREDARDEMIRDEIISAIDSLDPLPLPEYIPVKRNTRHGILAFGDAHFGTEFCIKDLFGEVINEYSPEIFYSRMDKLLSEAVEICRRENFTELVVLSLGDFIDGILRAGQLLKLRYGVVDATIKYVDYISRWLSKLTQFVRVEYHQANGNHDELRMLGQQKGTFKDDNMGKIVTSFIKTRLENNENFHYVENPTDLTYAEVGGYNIIGMHGETNSLEKTLKSLQLTYKIRVDVLVGAHLHHSETEDVARGTSVVRIPSIIGVDNFSMSLNATSDPGATLFVVEDGKGKNTTYDIKL